MKTTQPGTTALLRFGKTARVLAGSILALILAGSLATPSAQAADGTWLNTGTSANWTDTANWVGGTVPGATVTITGSNADTSGSR